MGLVGVFRGDTANKIHRPLTILSEARRFKSTAVSRPRQIPASLLESKHPGAESARAGSGEGALCRSRSKDASSRRFSGAFGLRGVDPAPGGHNFRSKFTRLLAERARFKKVG